ncbi:MAG: Gfo/Idh/MocA family protein [Candidatus Brocadiia bacterium]
MLKAIIVGAGHRGLLYASYANSHPDRLGIVGVADPDPLRRQKAAEQHDIPADMQWETAQELAAEPRHADFIINATMDHHHVPTSIPLLEAGYDILLEKPFATNEDEMWDLVETARSCDRRVAICHVLRYAPFYAAIRQRVAAGEIGDILNVQLTEHVSYHHMAVGFVRGKWNNEAKCHSTMLMAKSCHDLDLMIWVKSGIRPARVASFGSNYQFMPEKAPENAGTRCLVDCPIEEDCLYSARKHYIDHPDRWSFYVWASLEDIENPTIEDKIESLKTDNPFGRCVWKCDNDVVDHQSVVVDFEDGCTGTMNMIGGTAKPGRSIHLVGTEGEIQGAIEDTTFVIRHIDTRPGHEYSEEEMDINAMGDTSGVTGGHGGGDLRLVDDFVRVLSGEQPSISWTGLEDSVSGHLIGFAADEAREDNTTVDLQFQL